MDHLNRVVTVLNSREIREKSEKLKRAKIVREFEKKVESQGKVREIEKGKIVREFKKKSGKSGN